MVPILLLLVLIVGVGVGVLAMRNRTEHGIESGISSFRREMRALAPRPGDADPAGPPTARSHVEQDPGVHLLGDDHRPESGSADDSTADPDGEPAESGDLDDPSGEH